MVAQNVNSVSLMRQLVSQYSQGELESCIETQLDIGVNPCVQGLDNEKTMNLLAKTGYLSSVVEKGIDFNTALRDLARSMRQYQ